MTIISIIIMGSCLNAYGKSKQIFCTDERHLAPEIQDAAKEWKDAILSKNISVIINFALPEYRKKLEEDLNSKDSKLYQLFFDTKWNEQHGRRSFHDILRDAKQLKMCVEQRKELSSIGEGLSIYFYDEQNFRLQSPINIKTMQALIDQGAVLDLFLFKADNKWYISYEFSSGDEYEK